MVSPRLVDRKSVANLSIGSFGKTEPSLESSACLDARLTLAFDAIFFTFRRSHMAWDADAATFWVMSFVLFPQSANDTEHDCNTLFI